MERRSSKPKTWESDDSACMHACWLTTTPETLLDLHSIKICRCLETIHIMLLSLAQSSPTFVVLIGKEKQTPRNNPHSSTGFSLSSIKICRHLEGLHCHGGPLCTIIIHLAVSTERKNKTPETICTLLPDFFSLQSRPVGHGRITTVIANPPSPLARSARIIIHVCGLGGWNSRIVRKPFASF